tara:strand:- start:188 stop:625 length:438 start_codon:yes stop_codon:yes gene_type:complete
MNVMMQGLQVCNPTKINDSCFFIGLSTNFRLVVSQTDHGWHYRVFTGSETSEWHPQNDGSEVCNSAVDKIKSVVSGWKFLREGAWPDWETPPVEPLTVSMKCYMCSAQGEFEDLDEAYCCGWYINEGDEYCSEHAEEGIREADEQ